MNTEKIFHQYSSPRQEEMSAGLLAAIYGHLTAVKAGLAEVRHDPAHSSRGSIIGPELPLCSLGQ